MLIATPIRKKNAGQLKLMHTHYGSRGSNTKGIYYAASAVKQTGTCQEGQPITQKVKRSQGL